MVQRNKTVKLRRRRRRRTPRQRGGTQRGRSITGSPLEICSRNPLTGYARDGYCSQRPDDQGTHVVCARVTDEFLQFTKKKGNNLITPSPESNFPGLKSGDRWCLCALRWAEAERAGKAPPVILKATHESAQQFNPKSLYEQHAV